MKSLSVQWILVRGRLVHASTMQSAGPTAALAHALLTSSSGIEMSLSAVLQEPAKQGPVFRADSAWRW